MDALEFIRGFLAGAGCNIDLSDYVTEGIYEIYLDEHGEVHRYWSCSINEDINLHEGDDDDDIPLIIRCLQTELIKRFNPQYEG